MNTKLLSQTCKTEERELLCQICKMDKPIRCDMCEDTFYCQDQYDFHIYTRHDAQ